MKRGQKLKILFERIERTKKRLEEIRQQNIERGILSKEEAISLPVYYLAEIENGVVVFPCMPLDIPAVVVNLAIDDYRYKRAILLGRNQKQLRFRKLHDLHRELVKYKLFRTGKKTSASQDRSNRVSAMHVLAQAIYSEDSSNMADDLVSKATKALIQGKYRFRHPKR